MSWHEEPGPAVRPTPPKCYECDGSKRVHDDGAGDWKDCPRCAGVRGQVGRDGVVVSPPYDR